LVHCKVAVGGISMVRKKKTDEYEGRIKQALVVLGEVSEDSTTPRNIRRAAKDSMSALQSGELKSCRILTCLHIRGLNSGTLWA